MHLFKNDVNRKGSQTWLNCNDNSRSKLYRDLFVQKNGGKFELVGGGWRWSDDTKVYSIQQSDTPKVKTWIFEDATGTRHSTINLSEFCKNNNLSRPKIYELMNKTRKTHKGYKFIGIEENPA
jgi:hypothetical protein